MKIGGSKKCKPMCYAVEVTALQRGSNRWPMDYRGQDVAPKLVYLAANLMDQYK